MNEMTQPSGRKFHVGRGPKKVLDVAGQLHHLGCASSFERILNVSCLSGATREGQKTDEDKYVLQLIQNSLSLPIRGATLFGSIDLPSRAARFIAEVASTFGTLSMWINPCSTVIGWWSALALCRACWEEEARCHHTAIPRWIVVPSTTLQALRRSQRGESGTGPADESQKNTI